MTTPTKPPLKPIGYTQTPQYNWPAYEDEPTPELQWPQSIAVFDAMRKQDAQVASVLRAVTLLVRCTPWRVDPNGARNEVVEFVAGDLGLPIVGRPPAPPQRTKGKFSWTEHLRLALLMLPFGHAYFEQLYRVDPDGSRAHLRKLELRPSRTIDQVDVATDGGLNWIKQHWTHLNTEPKPIPVDRLVAYVNEREGGNWLGQSILRGVYKNWLLKDRLLRVQAQTIERNGMGVPRYTAAEDETELETGRTLATSWRSGEAAGAALPHGAQLDLVGVTGTLPDAEPAVRYHDEQIARQMLAHFLNLGTQTGSWALGTTFADFFTLSVQTVAEQVRDTATQHVVEDIVDVNWGEAEPAPKLVFDEIGSQQAATAQAIKSLVDAGVLHPDETMEESTRQKYGLPVRDPSTTFAPPPDVSQDGSPQVPVDSGSERPGSVAAAGDAGPKDGPFPGVGREPLRRRARRLGITLPRGASRAQIVAALAAPVAAKYNPLQPRVPGGEDGGQWTVGGAIKDVLKLLGKIDLDKDETLLGSGKLDADSGGARFALTRLGDGSQSWRVGFGDEGYGTRDRGGWDGNASPPPLSKDERERLNAESEELDFEYDSASPARKAEIDARFEAIRKRLDADDEGFNGTAKVDEYGIDRLSTRTTAALAEAVEQDKAEDAAWDELEALEAAGNGDPARIAELKRITRQDSRVSDFVTFDEGVIPGNAWGDIHFSVWLDETTTAGGGPMVTVGVKPKGTPDDWGGNRSWEGRFTPAEWRRLMRQIEAMRAARKR